MRRRRQESGDLADNGLGDWEAAQTLIIQETFQRHLSHNISLITSMHDANAIQQSQSCYPPDEAEALAGRVSELQKGADQARAALAARSEELAVAREQLAALRSCDVGDGEDECDLGAVFDAHDEIASLRGALNSMAASTRQLVQSGDLQE